MQTPTDRAASATPREPAPRCTSRSSAGAPCLKDAHHDGSCQNGRLMWWNTERYCQHGRREGHVCLRCSPEKAEGVEPSLLNHVIPATTPSSPPLDLDAPEITEAEREMNRALNDLYASLPDEIADELEEKVIAGTTSFQARLFAQRTEIESLRARREYDDADMKKLGEWVQANLNHHAGLSWSEGIAREFAALRARAEKAEALYAEALDTDKAMVAVWKATIERDSRDIERAAVELDVYEFRTFALLIVRRWLGKSKEIIR